MTPTGRVLALDIGTKRMGAALSDPLGMTVRSLGFINGTGRKEFLGKAVKMVEEYEPRAVVVGIPLNMDSSRGPMAEKAQKFADQLRLRLKVPVQTIDERLTTKEAERLLVSANVNRKKRKSVIDGIAASLILQKFLGMEKSKKAGKNESS